MKGKTINEIHIGDTASMQKQITYDDISQFAGVTGDYNPVHLDEEAAKESVFGTRVAHGMLSGSLFSAVIGCQLPGEGCIYLEQNLRFTKPVYPGDTVTATVSVTALDAARNRVTLDTVAANQRGETVIKGTALVMPVKRAGE